MPKTFFWIKLKDNFFKQLAIKKLRKIAGGDTFVIIYLKMMLLSMNNEGKIAYECDDGAEFAENLALELDEEEDNVNMTLGFLKAQKLIEFLDDGEAFLPEVAGCIGSETDAAERKRKSRANKTQKLLTCDGSVTMSQSCPKNVTLEKEIEKEIDIEKDISAVADIKKGDSYNHILDIQYTLGMLPTQYQAERLTALFGEVGPVIFHKALEKAAKANVKNINYVEAVARGLASGDDFDDKPKNSGALDFDKALKEM